MSSRWVVAAVAAGAWVTGVAIGIVQVVAEPSLAVLLLVTAVAVTVLLIALARGLREGAAAPSPPAVRGTRGLDGGPRARTQGWARLPGDEAPRAVQEWMETVLTLPPAWQEDALYLVALATASLPEPDRSRVLAARARAMASAPEDWRTALWHRHAGMLGRLRGPVREQEARWLTEVAAAWVGRASDA